MSVETKPRGRAARASGTGSVHRNGTGYRWLLKVAGVEKRGKTWSTYAEAEHELERVRADPSFVPEPILPRVLHRGTLAAILKSAKGETIRVSTSDDDQIERAERVARRWRKADPNGVRWCVPCRGEGIDRRPGEGSGRCCLNCLGEGKIVP